MHTLESKNVFCTFVGRLGEYGSMDKNLENDIPTFSIEELAGILRGSEETGKKPIFLSEQAFPYLEVFLVQRGSKKMLRRKYAILAALPLANILI